MLEITGEYIVMREDAPESTLWQRILSYVWRLKLYGTAEGADWVRYLYFKDTYTLVSGVLVRTRRDLVRSEDLREKNKRDGLDY